MDKFVELLVQKRKLKNISQETLAYELGMSRNLIGYYERKQSVPSLTNAVKIAMYLDIDLNQLKLY